MVSRSAQSWWYNTVVLSGPEKEYKKMEFEASKTDKVYQEMSPC